MSMYETDCEKPALIKQEDKEIQKSAKESIERLARKAVDGASDDALRFTQAALNLANMLRTLKDLD